MSRKPKAIITSIDNSHKFAWLSENINEVPCIAIQNGLRLTYDADNEYAYYCKHLFCFGDREVEVFPKLGYKVDHFYPVGSLNLANNFDKNLLANNPVYDLLVVSCWRGNIGYQQDVVDSMRAMRIMDELLSQYLNTHDLKAAVILRSERDSDQWVMPEIGMSEEEYYQSIYGDLIEIIDVNFSERNVYPLMQVSDVVIAGFSTTCLLEAFVMDRKILYANFCGTDKYHVDFNSEIVFKGEADDFEGFKSRLDMLLETSNQDYFTKHQDLINYYIRQPSKVETSNEIREGIAQIVLSQSHNKREKIGAL